MKLGVVALLVAYHPQATQICHPPLYIAVTFEQTSGFNDILYFGCHRKITFPHKNQPTSYHCLEALAFKNFYGGSYFKKEQRSDKKKNQKQQKLQFF